MYKRSLFFSLFLVLLLAACAVPRPPAASEKPASLTLITHDSFDVSESVLQQFTEQSGIEVKILKSGDAGEMLNSLLLSPDNPLGDVVYGIDNTFLSRALAADLFSPYEAPALADIPQRLQLDPSYRLLPVDYGYVTLNYDIAWFEKNNLQPPADIKDLIDPAYKGLTVVENPASSSPGLAFLFITVGRYGSDYPEYWKALRANDVKITEGWNDAYWGAFTVGSGGEGDRPIVVSYATSPVAEVYFNELDAPPTASVNSQGNSFEQVEFVGVLAASPHQQAARQLVDFLLSPTFQEDIPLHMFVYPANSKANVGDLFQSWAKVPSYPVILLPEVIDAHREEWIETWTDIMLR